MDIRKRQEGARLSPFLKQFLKIALIPVSVASLIFLFNHFHFTTYFPIQTVRVYGVKHSDQREIQQLLTPLVSASFFNIHIERIQNRLLQLPWVSRLSVRRLWPDQLEITLVEKNAIASWNNADLLSEEGEIFMPSLDSYPLGLPRLEGPNGKQIVMLDYFNQINRILLPLHAKISYLKFDPNSSWSLALDNGITVRLGNNDILTRLSQFVKVYSKIVGERAREVEYIDLRYANGIAVRWKTVPMAT